MFPTVFHKTLENLTKPNISVKEDKGSVIIHSAESEESQKISHAAAHKITSFLLENRDNIQEKDIKFIHLIKDRLINSAEGDEKLESSIHEVFKEILASDKEDPSKMPNSGIKPMTRIICEISPTPKNNEELLNNLHLVINNSSYILSESLAVIDTNRGHTTESWSKKTVFDVLKQKLHEIESDGSIEIATQETLNGALKEAIDLFIPTTIVPLSIIMHPGPEPDNGAMQQSLLKGLQTKVPTLTTHALIKQMAESKDFGSGEFLKAWGLSVYVQKEGGFILFLPESSSLKNLGLNPDNFQKFDKPLSELEFHPLSVEGDLSSALLDDQDDVKFRRLVYDNGHGLSGNLDQAHIGGLLVPEFQSSLLILSKKGMVFLYVETCYAGGGNTAQIALPTGIVSCPTIMASSTDQPSLTIREDPHLTTNAAGVMLYPNTEMRNAAPKQLTQNDMKKLGNMTVSDQIDKRSLIPNMQSFLLPSNQPDIPHVAYSGFITPMIMDVDQELKQLRKSKETLPENIEDKNQLRLHYFFSRPVCEATIRNDEVSGPVGLVSRGGNNFHILNRLELPKVELTKIVSKSWQNIGDAPNKLFAIGSMQCLMEDKEVELKNIVVGGTREGLFFAFKNENDPLKPYKIVQIEIPPGKEAKIPSTIDFSSAINVSLEEFSEFFYSKASDCKPSVDQLMVSTAGRQGTQDFFSQADKIFWEDKPPPVARMCQSIIQEGFIFKPGQTQSLFKATVDDLVKQHDQEALNRGISLAIKQNQPKIVEKFIAEGVKIPFKDYAGEPLLKSAVRSGNIEMVKLLLENGADPNHLNNEGFTPLHNAIASGSEKIVQLLLSEKADPTLKASGKTAFEMAVKNPNIFKILANTSPIELWNAPFADGLLPIFYAVDTKNAAFLNLLLELKAPLDITEKDGWNPIQYAVINSAPANIKQILSDGGCKFEPSETFNFYLETYLEDSLKTFYESIRGTNLSIDAYSETIEKKIRKSGNSAYNREAVEDMLKRGCKYPLSEEAKTLGVEACLAKDASDKKYQAILFKLKGGWEFDPKNEKMQIVYLKAAVSGNQEILNELSKKNVQPNLDLWLDSEWQKSNQLTEKEILQTILTRHPEFFNKVNPETQKTIFLKEASAGHFEHLKTFMDQQNMKMTPFQFLKSDLAVSAEELSELEDEIIGTLVKKGNPMALADLENNGYVLSDNLKEKLFLACTKNIAGCEELAFILLDRGLRLEQQQRNQLIIELIKLGRSSGVKSLQERGYRLMNLMPSEVTALKEIYTKSSAYNIDPLISSLTALVTSGFDIRTLPIDARSEFKEKVTKNLEHHPYALDLFIEQLHLR